MELKSGEDVFQLETMSDGNSYWIAIVKNGIQVGNPDVTANDIMKLIVDLKRLLHCMMEG